MKSIRLGSGAKTILAREELSLKKVSNPTEIFLSKSDFIGNLGTGSCEEIEPKLILAEFQYVGTWGTWGQTGRSPLIPLTQSKIS
jgi:hypothetical protein